MEFFDDPEDMGTEERVAEVAAILATGLLRFRSARAASPSTAESANALFDKDLDASSTESPPLDEGSTGREPAPMEATG